MRGGGLPAQILLLCGNFPLEQMLRFLTGRLMAGAVERAGVPGRGSLVSQPAAAGESPAPLPAR